MRKVYGGEDTHCVTRRVVPHPTHGVADKFGDFAFVVIVFSGQNYYEVRIRSGLCVEIYINGQNEYVCGWWSEFLLFV